jgi:SNF2 family DNA or RNA helicase
MKFKELAHDYQKVVVNHLIKKPKCGIFVDMGLGKTASCLYAFSYLKQKGKVTRMLIIAPKFVALHTWKDEIEKWDEFTNLTINIAVGNENKRLESFENESDIVIINRDNVSWMHKNVSMKSFQVLCVDELSSFKNPKAYRTLSLFKIVYNFKYRWGLTGTPVPKGYLDLFGQMLVIEPKLFGFNFWSYRNKYFYEASKYNWSLKAGKKEEIDSKLKEVCISLTAKDYLNMSPCINNHVSVSMDNRTLKIYKKALNEMVYMIDCSN